ncbi:HSP20-like chaperone [Serendipita vermifera]|nr:HSP20-like chaperone [Serendipita vermifera]
MDIYRTESTYTVTVELPGLKKSDVDISVQDGHLTISGKFDEDDDEKKKGCFVVRERRYGKFKRTIRLPSWVNVDDIKATMEHGVLTLVFEKPQPENNARKVSIL